MSIRVTGKVQGVYFRATARDVANHLGLKGYVMNLPDGSVYLEIEGEKKALAQMISWCKTGPPAAVVDHLVTEDLPLRDFQTFELRR